MNTGDSLLAKNILVALDSSEKSWKALDYAITFSIQNSGSRLHIVHAVQRLILPAAGDMGQAAYIVMEQEEAMIEEGRQLVRRAIDYAKSRGADEPEAIMEKGNTVDVILDAAEKKGADVIILGNRGMGFAKGALLGSVSERVVANSPVTVIVVK